MIRFVKSFIHDLWFTSTLKRVLIFSCFIGLYSLIPLIEFKYFDQSISENLRNLEAVFGVVTGLVLLFRANRAYERWWEARSLWGSLINVSRNLAIKMQAVGKLNSADLAKVVEFINQFCVALQARLNVKQNGNAKSPVDVKILYAPLHLTEEFYRKVHVWREQNKLSIEEFWIVDSDLRQFMDILGGCEKIKNTYIALSFRVFSRQLLLLFILILPWVFVHSFGIHIILFSILTTYLILGIEEIAYNLEEPFGESEDHLDMAQMVKTIHNSTREIMQP